VEPGWPCRYNDGLRTRGPGFDSRQVHKIFGRAIVQAVNRWLPTAATRVRARVWSSGICGGLVLRFRLPISIPPNLHPHNHPGQVQEASKWPTCRVDPVWTPPLSMRIKKNQVGSRDSAVGIATGYGLDDREVGVRVLVGSRIFSSPRRPDRRWGPPNLLSNGYRGVWSWPLNSS
jgi:hypothetical protein